VIVESDFDPADDIGIWWRSLC